MPIDVAKLRARAAEETDGDGERVRQQIAGMAEQFRLGFAQQVARSGLAGALQAGDLGFASVIADLNETVRAGFEAWRPKSMIQEIQEQHEQFIKNLIALPMGRDAPIRHVDTPIVAAPTGVQQPSGLTVVKEPAIIVPSKNRGGRPRRWPTLGHLVNYLALTLGPFIVRELSTANAGRESWSGVTQFWAAEKLGVPWPTVRDWSKAAGSTWGEVRALVEDQVFRQLSVSSSDSEAGGDASTLRAGRTTHARFEVAHR